MHNPVPRVSTAGDLSGAQADLARREIGTALKLALLFGNDRLAAKHQDNAARFMLRAHCGLGPETR
jgi:hypothetical protein